MVLVPPWKLSFTTGQDHATGTASLGYHPIWFQFEAPANDERSDLQQRIDLVRLGIGLGVVLVATNGLLLLARQRP